jgi:Na+/pantothenate symporter
VAGVIIYKMRVDGQFQSLHHFLESRYGRMAMLLFSLLIAFRLFNEVWSNTMVIGTYFGAKNSAAYYWSIIVFTALTLVYALKGGLRSSLLTDLIQMLLFGGLLFVILGILIPKKGGDVGAFVQSGEWTMAGGLNLFFVALIQVFSYPFHDPVLTDRAFIASPKLTLRSFILATVIGSICILLFSFVGIYAQMEGMQGQAPVEVSKALGVGMMLMMNFIMITSAASTLDSTFTSFSKLLLVDLGKAKQLTIRKGRITMIIVAIAGTLPIFFSPEILSATTVSGTMIIGLTPIFLFWKTKAPESSFLLSVGIGILIGVLFAAGLIPEDWYFFEGKYGDLLSVNIVGVLLCTLVFWLPILINRK